MGTLNPKDESQVPGPQEPRKTGVEGGLDRNEGAKTALKAF